MSFGTVLLVLGTGLLIFLVTLQLLRRGRIPVKFSILWFIVAVILLVVGIFPNFIVLISTRIGFISMSNMLVGILIFLLFAMCIALTVIVSGQATKITLLIQEVSMLKKKIMDKKVTIIIPVYIAGANIEHCIQSILKQTSRDFKVLLINDGSTDDSLIRITEYANRYPDIFKVLTHENMGVVETRHRGIKEADTEYIMFMDNDDFIDNDYVEVLLNEIEKTDSDIVITGYRRANFDKVLFTIPAYDDEWTKYRITAPWARIFRRNFLVENNVRFLKTYIGEDTYFNMNAYLYTNKIHGLDYVGYNWYYNDESVSNVKQRGLKPECDVLVVLNEIDKLYKEKDEYLNYFVTRHIIWYLLFSGVDATPQRFMEEYKRLFEWLKNQGYKLSIPFYSKKIKSEPFKNRLIISIFNFLSKIGLVSIFTKIYCKGK